MVVLPIEDYFFPAGCIALPRYTSYVVSMDFIVFICFHFSSHVTADMSLRYELQATSQS